MNNFKTDLKNIPIEVFKKFEAILSEEYDMYDIQITGIDIANNRELTAEELTEEDCAKQGKKLKCKKRLDGSIKCWCVKR
ncbi:hypothetical protein [uncultured Croceitalea sp.]|uniref:hypothetical protein n=1 Tax=uncultured Croceitalea sp. TaxID=1798908 RepID=UPI003305A4DE